MVGSLGDGGGRGGEIGGWGVGKGREWAKG